MSLIYNCSRRMQLLVHTARWFSTSSACSNKQALQRRWQRMTERYLKRTVDALSGAANRSQKSKRGPQSHAVLPLNFGVSSAASLVPNAGCQRRARQLSTVFYNYITSLLSSGEVCPELNEIGFEVVQVKVVSDMSVINVLWAASGEPEDNQIAALLPRCATELRSALIDLRIMGNVPPIQFVKDLTAARLQEVEELLKKADMGPEHIPTEIGDGLKTEPVLVAEGTSAARRNVPVPHQLQGMTFKPGPGGSFEVSAAHENQTLSCTIEMENHNAFTDAGAVCDESGIHDALPVTHFRATAGCPSDTARTVGVSQHYAGDYHCAVSGAAAPCRGKDVHSFEGDGTQARFRSDIYGLDHGTLYQQVLHTKRRAEDRSYVQQQQIDSEEGIRTWAGVRQAKAGADGFVMDRRKNAKRSFRELNRLLSSQFHQYSDD